MSVEAVVGANWGDEGKGKITDFLAGEADVVVRYQGGRNAGIRSSTSMASSRFTCFLPAHFASTSLMFWAQVLRSISRHS